VVAHEGACARKAAQDCRPVSEAADTLVHLWQPAGTIFCNSEVRLWCPPFSFAWPGSWPCRTRLVLVFRVCKLLSEADDVWRMQDAAEEAAVQVCVYCRRPCDADVFSLQAVWTCAWCQANAHVSCYQAYHDIPGAGPAKQEENGQQEGHAGSRSGRFNAIPVKDVPAPVEKERSLSAVRAVQADRLMGRDTRDLPTARARS
jgi:hypothetical protein